MKYESIIKHVKFIDKLRKKLISPQNFKKNYVNFSPIILESGIFKVDVLKIS